MNLSALLQKKTTKPANNRFTITPPKISEPLVPFKSIGIDKSSLENIRSEGLITTALTSIERIATTPMSIGTSEVSSKILKKAGEYLLDRFFPIVRPTIKKVKAGENLLKAYSTSYKELTEQEKAIEEEVKKEYKEAEERGVSSWQLANIAQKSPRVQMATNMVIMGSMPMKPFKPSEMNIKMARGILKVSKKASEKVIKNAFNKALHNPKLYPKLAGIAKESGKAELELLRSAREVLLGKITKVSPIKGIVPRIGEVKPKALAKIEGKTFTLETSDVIKPTLKDKWKLTRQELKATKKEIKNAEIARQKASKLLESQAKIRKQAIEGINTQRGDTDKIIAKLKKKYLSTEDIDNIILEDGTKLVDTIKVKRNADKSLATIIKKSEINDLAKSYTGKIPPKWQKVSTIKKAKKSIVEIARGIELPSVYFERKGLQKLYKPMVEAGRASESQLQLFYKRFKDAGIFKEGLFTKEGGWFTPARFTLSKQEAENVGKYYLSKQGKYPFKLPALGKKEKKFIEIFDNIIKETEPRFFEIAKKMGKTPTKVKNYAPLMTAEDIELADRLGAMEWLFRKHPSFSALKERVAKKVPVKAYELDYRKVASRWLGGATDFLNYSEETQRLKYLINSDQFKKIITLEDHKIISDWLRNITTPEVKGVAAKVSGGVRRLIAIGTLGLNYASVVKQALTQIPIMIIDKVSPKLKSSYAKAFGIDVKMLPSITKRSGDIAISDLQGKIGRLFVGSLTRFDKLNAQVALNGFLDKEWGKVLKEGIEVTPEIRKLIESKAQSSIDMWFGGFFKGQRPEYFRKEVGNFFLMFLYPLTSQLNGFYRHILTAKGVGGNIKAIAEVLAAATAIAYAEQSIEKLSFKWSDEKEMAKDVTQSLLGNIPMVSQIGYSLMTDQPYAPSPVVGSITSITKNINKARSTGDWEKTIFSIVETLGIPKQIRRVKEGMEIIEEGGIRDRQGKMLAPVKETDEIVRSVLRGKYGSMAAQDWVRNIGEKKENRRWFVPQVEFLQNGDYNRKAELYLKFTDQEQQELREFLSKNQLKKLDKVLKETPTEKSLNDIFETKKVNKSLDDIFE